MNQLTLRDLEVIEKALDMFYAKESDFDEPERKLLKEIERVSYKIEAIYLERYEFERQALEATIN